jgi:hypothetical protein
MVRRLRRRLLSDALAGQLQALYGHTRPRRDMQQPNRIVSFEIHRPGTGEDIARADAAVAELLGRLGYGFDHADELRWAVAELAMIVFSGGTDEQLGRYLREAERHGESPYVRTDTEYAAASQSIRAAFGAPAV